MSRTRRKPISWVEWLNDFGKRIIRGLADMPKKELYGIDEVWGRRGKKSRKREISRSRRRNDKLILSE